MESFNPIRPKEPRAAAELNQPTPYELLVGHERTDGSFKTSEQLRSQYIELTDELIYTITSGVEVVNNQTGERELRSPDYVIWLDKSARPVAWLTKELWPILAQEEDGSVPGMPEFKFVNIDREQWVNMIDPNGVGAMQVDNIDSSIIRSLRSIFTEPKYKSEGLTEAIDSSSSLLDNKVILIVDEVQASGRTLNMANSFFKKAFPSANIATKHWMAGQTTKFVPGAGMAQGNADLPVWYKESTVSGRGVGNRNDRLSEQSKSITQRLGSYFLSTRLQGPDPDSRQLRQEIKQLAEDVKINKILVVPSLYRDDFMDRAVRMNDMANFDEFKDARTKLRDHGHWSGR